MSDPIYQQLRSEAAEPVATTAGEQDHSDPWAWAGEDADAPTNDGTPATDGA